MVDDSLKVHNTWLGGELVVENKKITSLLDDQLTNKRYKYPTKAYNTVHLPKKIKMIPDIPNKEEFKINVIKTQLPGIVTIKEKIQISESFNNWLDYN